VGLSSVITEKLLKLGHVVVERTRSIIITVDVETNKGSYKETFDLFDYEEIQECLEDVETYLEKKLYG